MGYRIFAKHRKVFMSTPIPLLKKWATRLVFPHLRRSYSQSGEDIIIADLFQRLKMERPTFLDIGTNDPIALSNTYRLYTRGSRGVCVEPNPVLCRRIRQKRKQDTCLNAGIAFSEAHEADYYVFEDAFHGLNTFSKSEATFWKQTGTPELGRPAVKEVRRVPLLDINEVMGRYFRPHPNLLSIDVEGLDLTILKRIDFDRFAPEVICTETLGYTDEGREFKKMDVTDFLHDKGYFSYADTYINTIFCRSDAYPSMQN